MKPKRRPIKIRSQFLLAMTMLTVLLTVLFTVYLYESEKTELMNGIDNQLRTAAIMTQAMLPTGYHDHISGPDSVNEAEYLSIVDKYNKLCLTLDLEYLWSLMLIDGKVVFTTSTSPDEISQNKNQAAFFETHSNPEIYLPTLISMKPTYQINDDKWGRIRVALIPFQDSKGRPYLVGASIRLTEVDELLDRLIKQCFAFGFLLLCFSIILSFVLANSITKPIRSLTETMDKIYEGQDEVMAEDQGSFEQTELSRSFNSLSRRLHEKIAEIAEQEEKYRVIAENTGDVISVFNINQNKFTYISPSIMQLRRFTPEEAMSQSLEDSMTPESFKQINESFEIKINEFIQNPQSPNQYSSEIQQLRKNGDIIWVGITSKYLYNAKGEIEVINVSRSIEARKKTEKDILFLSYHDYLTGLYNRRFYEEKLRRLDTEENLPIALIMADLNGLKLANDSFGHETGDGLLKRTAEILRLQCQSSELVARIGGDEFIIVLPKSNEADAEKFIGRMRDAMSKDKDEHIVLSLSMGFAVKMNVSENMSEVFRKAEDDMYSHKSTESPEMRSKSVKLMLDSLFKKDAWENLHSVGVSEISASIATKMNYTPGEVNKIRIAGLMHDIGKIGLNDAILNKNQELTDAEWEEIKRHPEIGYRILNSVGEFHEIAWFVLSHHERWDGKGYPKGLKHEEISFHARILAVADAYDAMRSDRTYRKALSEEEAIAEIRAGSGLQFDPEIVKILIGNVLEKDGF